MRILQVFILSLVFLLPVSGQTLSQWKNLKFDSTTPEEAIAILGKPKRDKIEQVKFAKEVPVETREQMKFRKLEFKKIDEFKNVNLLFLNGKLHNIELIPEKKKMLAADLENRFETNFLFLEGMPKILKFADYEGQKETTVPKVYPIDYFMIAVKADMAVLATIDNVSWKSFWRDTFRTPTEQTYPGYITNLKIFSRSLETK